MTTYVMRGGRLVEKECADCLLPAGGIHTISDTMPVMRHPITGKLMDSKSEFRKVTRAHGCIEVGNDKWSERRPIKNSPVAPDIGRAWDELSRR